MRIKTKPRKGSGVKPKGDKEMRVIFKKGMFKKIRFAVICNEPNLKIYNVFGIGVCIDKR